MRHDETGQIGVVLIVQQDEVGGQRLMHDPGLMGGIHAQRQLIGQPQHSFQRTRAVRQRLTQRARQITGHHIRAGFVVPVIVERKNMRVFQPANTQGLGVEASHKTGLVGEFRADHAHQHLTAHRRLIGAVDRAGRPNSGLLAQLVALDELVRTQG